MQRTSRRDFLGLGLAAGAVLLPGLAQAGIAPLFCPPALGPDGRRLTETEAQLVARGVDPVRRAAIADEPGARRLRLGRNRFRETFDAVYFANGVYDPEALAEFAHYCRDGFRRKLDMDPGLMDLVRRLGDLLEVDTPFHVNSAYRSPEYNRKEGGKPGSLHLTGKALDIWHDKVRPSAVQRAAATLRAGGVGRYPSFTHIDTGRVRYW